MALLIYNTQLVASNQAESTTKANADICFCNYTAMIPFYFEVLLECIRDPDCGIALVHTVRDYCNTSADNSPKCTERHCIMEVRTYAQYGDKRPQKIHQKETNCLGTESSDNKKLKTSQELLKDLEIEQAFIAFHEYMEEYNIEDPNLAMNLIAKGNPEENNPYFESFYKRLPKAVTLNKELTVHAYQIDRYNLKLNFISEDDDQDITIIITDLSGRIIDYKPSIKTYNGLNEINISLSESLESGLYLLNIIDLDNNKSTGKINIW